MLILALLKIMGGGGGGVDCDIFKNYSMKFQDEIILLMKKYAFCSELNSHSNNIRSSAAELFCSFKYQGFTQTINAWKSPRDLRLFTIWWPKGCLFTHNDRGIPKQLSSKGEISHWIINAKNISDVDSITRNCPSLPVYLQFVQRYHPTIKFFTYAQKCKLWHFCLYCVKTKNIPVVKCGNRITGLGFQVQHGIRSPRFYSH